MQTEKALQVYFINKCRQAGALAYNMTCVGRRGFPDVLVVDKRGGTHYIELKSPTKKGVLSGHQKRFIADLEERGADVHVIDSKQKAEHVIGLIT
jgi:hypothetical protein